MQALVIATLWGLLVLPARDCLRLHAHPTVEAVNSRAAGHDVLGLYDAQEYWKLSRRESFVARERVDSDKLVADAASVTLTGHPKTICKHGKSMPVFYLLGGQKSSSTSVAASLAQSGVVWDGPKELHVFAQGPHKFYDFPGGERTIDGLLHGSSSQLLEDESAWEQNAFSNGHGAPVFFPNCGEENGAVADMTPSYMAATNITDALWRFYGEQARNLTFMIVMREPFQRMHSAYHYLSHRKLAGMYPKIHGPEYWEEFCLFNAMSIDKHHDGEYADAIEHSLYGKAVKKFLDAGFDASQFIIVPTQAYNDDAGAVVAATAEKLGMALHNSSRIKPYHSNSFFNRFRWHPSLETNKAKCSQGEWSQHIWMTENTFERDTQLLVKLLCEGQPKGMRLVGFHGEAGKGNCVEILRWIQKNW